MPRFHVLASLLLLGSSSIAFAQSSLAPVATPSASIASAESRQFDFLLGQWTLEVRPKLSGLVAMIHGQPRLAGTWKASRSADGFGIDDEMRIFDGSGNPLTLMRTHRTRVAVDKRWKIVGNDVTHNRTSVASGQWVGGEMVSMGRYTDSDGSQVLARTRYSAITPGGFRMQQDRSSDGGKTWDEATLVIDASRASAAAAR